MGYTATPFANIFIHEQGRTAENGNDLFPRSFIITLPAPSNYSGPVRIFGLGPANRNEEANKPLPLVRHISDHAALLNLNERQGWMPPRHRNGHRPLYNGQNELPLSLQEAILSFILVCTARRLRGQEIQHNSMLIHVTRFTNVQASVKRQVGEFLTSVKRRLKRGEAHNTDKSVLMQLQRLWETDFIPTTNIIREAVQDKVLTSHSWMEIVEVLSLVAEDIKVREINGSAGDILDYENYRETGLSVIAIGGDKLARGLTLEGLTISYFLRATTMYDTLMQMGRWFGYRPGYLDLCRLYTTHELEEWFQHITEASEDLREEFDYMAAVGGTPRDYGLKVRSHPVLMVTSQVKMRNAFPLQLAFAGSIPETVVFHHAREKLNINLIATESLLYKIGVPATNKHSQKRPNGGLHTWDGTLLWTDIPATHIVAFLRDYVTHEAAIRVNSQVLAEYIEKQQTIGELTNWIVAILSGGEQNVNIGSYSVKMVKRSPNERCYNTDEQKKQGRYIIRRLLAPRDEAIDLGETEYQAALDLTIQKYTENSARSRRKTPPDEPSGIGIRTVRGIGNPAYGLAGHPERGLLLLYPLAPEPAQIEFQGPIMGFGISFPTSERAQKISYAVNNIYWSQDYGGDE